MNTTNPPSLAILGSTGSVGRQALQLMGQLGSPPLITLLSSHNRAEQLIQQAIEHRPKAVLIGNDKYEGLVHSALSGLGIEVYAGFENLKTALKWSKPHKMLNAVLGMAGLEPTLEAVEQGIHILMANKEAMAVAGHLITRQARDRGVDIIPVDSELTAIWQCLQGEQINDVEKVYLTASGGPFRGCSEDQLLQVSVQEALQHPTWEMGEKISIDSATMMNKGLEVMAACRLFGLSAGQIEVLIHPQSVVHGILAFKDGSMKAQMSTPDMKQVIEYALGWPERTTSGLPRLNFDNLDLNFERADPDYFSSLRMAYEALEKGGNMPCVFNAANEAAVQAFLNGELPFVHIATVVEQSLSKAPFSEDPDLAEIMECHGESSQLARQLIKTIQEQNR